MKLYVVLFVILLVCTASALAQEAETEVIVEPEEVVMPEDQLNTDTIAYKEKNPLLASLFSAILPGGGQYYNGEIGKGIAFTVVTYGTVIAGMWLVLEEALSRLGDPDSASLGIAGVCFIVGFGSYVWSIVDAAISADRINQKNGLLNWSIGKNMNLSLKPDINALSYSFGGQKAFSPSCGAKVSLTF